LGTKAGYYEPGSDGKRPPECLYGSLKMWAHLQREGIPVARCTVERIMRANGWRGVTRARRLPRTTEPDPAAARAPDLVGRQWRVSAPNLLVVADLKCRRRQLKSYADLRNMPMASAMVRSCKAFDPVWSA
jgi:transposase InsO family protein